MVRLDAIDKELKHRREKLASSLSGSNIKFNNLLKILNLDDQFLKYHRDTAGICEGLREHVPNHVGDILCSDGKKQAFKETLLVSWYDQIVTHMMRVRNEYLDAQSNHNYEFVNHETRSLSGTGAKPDGIVYYGNYIVKDAQAIHILVKATIKEYFDGPSGDALGQMAEYAQHVWQSQPTRVFVPVVFLHSVHVDLVLFARCGYRYARLGRYISNSRNNSRQPTTSVLETIRRLWFFLTLPSEQFGHFVSVTREPHYLRFDGDKRKTTVSCESEESDDSFKITDTIETKVSIHRRAAYLLKVKYQGRDAVLKLSWTPVERQPEGALYDILSREKIECIPEVYRSGIVIPDFLGYRLEYIIMEDCGESLYAAFKKYGPKATMEDSLYAFVCKVVKKVCTCLRQAAEVGVFHRDASPGNITLRDDKVFLIDWGYGKVVLTTLSRRTKNFVNTTWNINLDKITVNEDACDGEIGTVPYMSVQVLMNRTKHHILDDIESVLYVVFAIASYNGADEFLFESLGKNKVDYKDQAIWKVGCMADCDDYLIHFGVSKCNDALRGLLDGLRKALFEKDGVFIGGKRLSTKWY
ncbi:hypothetical protein LPJ73_000330 [Coemansia sp. RSA 2703]|nr:hypothetical protein LPJ73_000330 [Coemansia sp. RSA 2703]KAJ2398240.1 hypothetical protein GGI05_000206 [Coemansia sp. RSA 2603]